MVQNKGINDMPRGWRTKNKYNKRLYKKWYDMLERCYSKKFQKRNPCYIGCTVCERWLLLSNFVEDFKLIDGYNEEKFLLGKLELDKDIKSNGMNHEYSLENCMLVSKSENSKQAVKTRDNTQFQSENNFYYRKFGANHPKSIKIAQYDKQTYELIKIWDGAAEIKRELNINDSNIIACCRWYDCGEDLNEWRKIRKNDHPHKSVGGFVWKYYKEEDK